MNDFDRTVVESFKRWFLPGSDFGGAIWRWRLSVFASLLALSARRRLDVEVPQGPGRSTFSVPRAV